MALEQIRQLIESNKDNQDVQSYLKGLNPITPEGVTSFLDTAEGKKMLQPKLDAHFTKGLETWKEKTLPSILDDEIRITDQGDADHDHDQGDGSDQGDKGRPREPSP